MENHIFNFESLTSRKAKHAFVHCPLRVSFIFWNRSIEKLNIIESLLIYKKGQTDQLDMNACIFFIARVVYSVRCFPFPPLLALSLSLCGVLAYETRENPKWSITWPLRSTKHFQTSQGPKFVQKVMNSFLLPSLFPFLFVGFHWPPTVSPRMMLYSSLVRVRHEREPSNEVLPAEAGDPFGMRTISGRVSTALAAEQLVCKMEERKQLAWSFLYYKHYIVFFCPG